MARVHVVANQKGGAGKTTVAVNLAAVTDNVLPRPADDPEQSPVLVVSTDPQASTVWWAQRVGEGLPFDFTQVEFPEPDPGSDELDPSAQREMLEKLRTSLTRMKASQTYQHVFVDTPGSLENGHILGVVLDFADDVIVPMPPEPLAFDPTKRTVTKVIQPRGLPYKVVVNSWDPRDGTSDLEQTQGYIDAQRWPRANVVVRRYKLHTRASAEGQVVTQYPKNRVAMEAREDFFRLALELGLGPAPAAPSIPSQGAAAPALSTRES